jgi:hypothetical protein
MFPVLADRGTDVHKARQILVSGRLLDAITSIVEGPTSQFRRDAVEEWHVKAFNLYRSSANRSQSLYYDWEDAFSRTVLGNDVYSGDHAMESYTPIADPKTTRRDAIQGLRSNTRWHKASVGDTSRSASTTYIQQTIVCCRRRRFAVGEKGYMGLVPEKAVVGDLVFLVSGCTVPFLLRPQDPAGADGPYVLVGECYIYRVMEGEPIDVGGDGEASWKAVRLC